MLCWNCGSDDTSVEKTDEGNTLVCGACGHSVLIEGPPAYTPDAAPAE